MRRWGSRLARAGSLALDLTLPPTCASCGAVGQILCGRCRARLERAEGPRCPRCWLRAEGVCRACMERPPALRQLRAPFRYDGVARQLVLTLKYSGVRRAAAPLVEEAHGPLVRRDIELIAPIPMTGWRRRTRGGNHAAHLAAALAAQHGIKLDDTLLARRGRRSKQQARMADIRQRRANMQGAFHVVDPQRVQGRAVLLVDDVATTMATLESAAAALLAAGAATVDGWAATREDLRD